MTFNLASFPYSDYPNPRIRREHYQLLNGIWEFAFLREMVIPQTFDRIIRVPFTYETEYSLIGDREAHEYVGYRRVFSVDGGNYLLHFEGIDYEARIYLDGKDVASHKGAYLSFQIPCCLTKGEHELVVLVHDTFSKAQMRGKQRTRNENYECWYTQFTGIFKDVYLEKVGKRYVTSIEVSGDKDGRWTYDIGLSEAGPANLILSYKGKTIRQLHLNGKSRYQGSVVEKKVECYSSEHPVLYDVRVDLDGEDSVATYFGFRTIDAKGGRLYLNDEELYLKMILNQGYYEKKGVTPEKEDVVKDLQLISEIGFNGIRIHQKQECHLFYYLCDVIGIYLWSEIPSCYEYSDAMKKEIEHSLPGIIRQNYNSPSVLAYVLFNESWGIPQINQNAECQEFVREIGKRTKELDQTRLAILNDGWFQLTESDILSLHEYEQNSEALKKEYQEKEAVLSEKIINHYGKAFAENNRYVGQPIVLSEFGGASLATSDGWGYGKKRPDVEDYTHQLKAMFSAVRSLPYLSGYCYTQLTDVEQETNGLFRMDRTPKIPLKTMREIIGGEKK